MTSRNYLLTITCVGLHYHSFEANDKYGLIVSTGTFCGFLIILIGVYAGYLFSMPISKRIDAFYSICGCALFVASGALSIDHFQHKKYDKELSDIGLAKGSLAVINGLVFLVDAIVNRKALNWGVFPYGFLFFITILTRDTEML
ncbi:conserved hypothetical protein [Pediculus humanus corporis]|uniref:Uncharacterized protein n=1 Tax=Pediculus humanus subsp. corporis TaxID=121224 RepID=E0VCQ7_PEDHC|nr:uncharacterized protein Phum_PHUM094210 [Pediculus humanus corporis]EEB11163.1 conserved hypothetical protein [Pediculus humanus corporis]